MQLPIGGTYVILHVQASFNSRVTSRSPGPRGGAVIDGLAISGQFRHVAGWKLWLPSVTVKCMYKAKAEYYDSSQRPMEEAEEEEDRTLFSEAQPTILLTMTPSTPIASPNAVRNEEIGSLVWAVTVR